MTLPDKLYELRKQSGLSQEQLAEKLNVSRQAVSKWETGASTPESEKLILIADYFNVSLDYLVKDDTNELLKNTELTRKSDKTKRIPWLIGAITCIGGMILLIVWGLIAIFKPTSSEQLGASSTVTIDGNGIFLALCIMAILIGAILLLKTNNKKE